MNSPSSRISGVLVASRAWLCTAAFALHLAPFAGADIVSDWNAKALLLLNAERVAGAAQSRPLALMHIAMFDAANAVARRYQSYLATVEGVGASGTADISAVAAVHTAARHVLAELYPRHKAAFDAETEALLARLPDGPRKTAGVALGRRTATAILSDRKSDGYASPNLYRPVTAPGVYVTTALPIMSHAAKIKPFALRDVAQFRPAAPPALDSALWARDYNEVKDLGGVVSTKRTKWQTETARFWVISGTDAWNQATRALVAGKALSLVESARLFAHVNMALFDAYLAIFEAKYHYGFWRPITAIRNGDMDGNDATERDAGWTPLIDTPLHPEYPCAHCVADGSAGAVLKRTFGTGQVPEFTLVYAAMPGVTRKYTSIQQLEDEVAMARIWGGVHYRTSTEVGNDLGRKVGEHVLDNTLRPIR